MSDYNVCTFVSILKPINSIIYEYSSYIYEYSSIILMLINGYISNCFDKIGTLIYLYPFQIYCRHCGAVPCPLSHEEEKETRLKDLDFVCGLVQSKKDMEAHVEKVIWILF